VVFETTKRVLADEEWLTLRSPWRRATFWHSQNERADDSLRACKVPRSTRGRVQTLLMPILHTGDPGVNTIADKMGLNARRFLGLLKAEGATFEKVVDELRHKMALEYLNGRRSR